MSGPSKKSPDGDNELKISERGDLAARGMSSVHMKEVALGRSAVTSGETTASGAFAGNEVAKVANKVKEPPKGKLGFEFKKGLILAPITLVTGGILAYVGATYFKGSDAKAVGSAGTPQSAAPVTSAPPMMTAALVLSADAGIPPAPSGTPSALSPKPRGGKR